MSQTPIEDCDQNFCGVHGEKIKRKAATNELDESFGIEWIKCEKYVMNDVKWEMNFRIFSTLLVVLKHKQLHLGCTQTQLL